ncbi:MAG: TIR domain-containing protein [Sinobacteraceae bacterium]|nr:TIR domain-containing protein [Nevskiaceae bacterium]
MSHDVFVSYCQAERESAFELVAQLEAQGISTWIAPRDIAPAVDWAAEIVTAISAARLMVLVFSEKCNSSPQVCREVERAVHRQVPVLTLRIEPALPTRSLEYFLSTQHWFDAFPPPRAAHYQRVLAHIRALLNPQSAGTHRSSAESPYQGPPPAHGKFVISGAERAALERQLAYHIGPVARFLVERALRSAGGREELTALLAKEIESPADRQSFLTRCRVIPH